MKCYIQFWGSYYCHYHIFGQEQSNMVLELDPTERKRAFLSDWLKNSPLKEVNHGSEQSHYSTISIGIPGLSYEHWGAKQEEECRPALLLLMNLEPINVTLKWMNKLKVLTLNYYLIHKHRLYSWAYIFNKSYISKLLCWQNEPLATGEHNINYELTISNLKMSQYEVTSMVQKRPLKFLLFLMSDKITNPWVQLFFFLKIPHINYTVQYLFFFGCQGLWGGGNRERLISYRMNKFWGSHLSPGDYSW